MFFQVSRGDIVFGSVEGAVVVTYEVVPCRVCVPLYVLDKVIAFVKRVKFGHQANRLIETELGVVCT